jgi:16S rRNA (adenine1518-N6/adenine1519-N6)-dimethyltransferase
MTLPSLRRFGQNFLVNRSAVDRIVSALAALAGESVLEIGPGRGALTEPLILATGRIGAVELDRGLAARLRDRFGESLRLWEQDVLQLKLAEVRRELDPGAGRPLVIVGNLPYNLSKPIAMKLISEREGVDRAVLMFQREVADRLMASPGSRAYGALSVLAGETYEIRRLFDLGGSAFRPRPRVTSSVTLWKPRIDHLPAEEEEGFKRCLRICFAHRRQTLRNNLLGAIPDTERVDGALDVSGIDGGRRAQSLAPLEFRRLATALTRR